MDFKVKVFQTAEFDLGRNVTNEVDLTYYFGLAHLNLSSRSEEKGLKKEKYCNSQSKTLWNSQSKI